MVLGQRREIPTGCALLYRDSATSESASCPWSLAEQCLLLFCYTVFHSYSWPFLGSSSSTLIYFSNQSRWQWFFHVLAWFVARTDCENEPLSTYPCAQWGKGAISPAIRRMDIYVTQITLLMYCREHQHSLTVIPSASQHTQLQDRLQLY